MKGQDNADKEIEECVGFCWGYLYMYNNVGLPFKSAGLVCFMCTKMPTGNGEI